VRSGGPVVCRSIFLHPFAPPALPGFHATMSALTPAGQPYRDRPARAVRSASRYPCFMPHTFRPFCRQPPFVVRRAWSGFVTPAYRRTLPEGKRLTHSWDPCVIWASPFASRLATTTGRIAFVTLRTGRSRSVALHPSSRRRSYVQLQSSDRTLTRTRTSPIQDTYKRTSRVRQNAGLT